MYPKSISNLIDSFKMFPGIGEKTAERLVFSILDMDEENIEYFAQNLNNIKEKVHKCEICNNITEDEICNICVDINRNSDLLCVVEDVKSIFLFEKMNVFNGFYHVLEGLISPIDGINPEDIGLAKLIDRIEKSKFKEIIFAFKPNIEGETTSLYIKKILADKSIKITRLANGVPIGADIEYVDSLTLERALSDRKEIS